MRSSPGIDIVGLGWVGGITAPSNQYDKWDADKDYQIFWDTSQKTTSLHGDDILAPFCELMTVIDRSSIQYQWLLLVR